MAQQLSYSQTHSAAYAGDKADSSVPHVLAGLNVDVVEIPYGRAVVLGTAPSNMSGNSFLPAVLPLSSADVFLGVCLHSQAHNPNNTNGVLVQDMFDVISKGVVYVEVEQAVTIGDAVYFRYDVGSATGTSPALGKFRKDADTSKALVLANARWLGKAAAGGIVALELGTP